MNVFFSALKVSCILSFIFLFSPQNLIAQSQSGTGKTAAFVLAMLSHVDPNNKYPQVRGVFLTS